MTARSGATFALVFGALTALPALAQTAGDSLFAPRVVINGQVISNYEFSQRMKFLQVLRVPGDPEKEAIKGLTTDKLSAQEAKRLAIRLTPEQIEAGMAEFASRANLDVAGFVTALNAEGVEAETFRDFVTAGLLWREVVRTRFGGKVSISDILVDRALAEAARKPDVRLLLSELVVPVPEGADPADVLAQVRDIKANLGESGFAGAARRYSASPTAASGGRLDWLEVSNLPPAIGTQLLGLAQGEVSEPVVVPQAVVLFQLNGLSDLESPPPADVLVSFAQFVPAGDQDAAAIIAGTDGCDDLYPLARALPAERLRVSEEVSMGAVPQDVGLALAQLDPGEAVVRDGQVLMLCARKGVSAEAESVEAATEAASAPAQAAAATPEGDFVKPDPQREDLRNTLGNQQLAAQAEAYMEELRSEAIIVTP